MWHETISKIMTEATHHGEISHIGLLTYEDDGYPITLPHHFQLQNDRIYFSSLPTSKHTLSFMKNPKISLTLYYPSLNQTTILIKGRPSLVQKNSVKYNYGEQNISSHLFELSVESIDLSELNPHSRNQQGIVRDIEKIFPTKKTYKRQILLNNDLDDIQEYMRRKNSPPTIL